MSTFGGAGLAILSLTAVAARARLANVMSKWTNPGRRLSLRVKILLGILGALILTASYFVGTMVYMPGSSFDETTPRLDARQEGVRDTMKADVVHLAKTIGIRNLDEPQRLADAEAYIRTRLTSMAYEVRPQTYTSRGQRVSNLEVELTGGRRAREIVIIGAHYDSAEGTPGANDNGSGVAALLALAQSYAGERTDRTLRFVAFVNEEPPYFKTDDMGSLVYARRSKERKENVVAMLSLETMGFFTDAPDSQKYPPPLGLLYPSTGNFITFVGNFESRELVKHTIDVFREHAKVASDGGALPGSLPGISWSDHWSFWEQGYPAIMITDTAPFRYPHYHEPTDTTDKLDYDRLTLVVEGLRKVIDDLLTR